MTEPSGLSSDSMYCHNCGDVISRRSVFCNWCGAAVSSANLAAPAPQEMVVSPVAPQQVMPPVYAPYPQAHLPVANKPHSGSGIASFVLACVSFVVLILMIGGVIANVDDTGISDAVIQTLDLMLFLSIGLMLIGVSTGIIGIVQSNRKKIFGTLGLIFNVLMLLSVLGILLLGYFANSV
jgi:hypothetical protein